MAYVEDIPLPHQHTSYAIQSFQAVQCPAEQAAPRDTGGPAASDHSLNAESKETSSLAPVQPQPRGGKASTAASQQPPQQADARVPSNSLSNPASIGENRPPQPPNRNENSRLLGIPAYQGHSYVDRSYDYRRKYPSDAEGKELESDARIWKVYLDECESYDNDMVKSFRDTIDSLLVFAALFSSVVTGFVVQTSQALEPDYAQIGAYLLFEQIQVLRAAGNATMIEEIPRSPLAPGSITHSTLDVIINWLFFASLAFSLATAFIAVLIKQWLQAFTALIPGDAKQRSLTRQFRFTGLQKWKLPEIINLLPLFLHFSLAFFLVGLCAFVSQFHLSMPIMVGVITFATLAFYIITGVLPAVHLDCPYRLPILYIPACLMVFAFRMIHFKIPEPLRTIPVKISEQLQKFIIKVSHLLRKIYLGISHQIRRRTSVTSPPVKPTHSTLRPSLSLSPFHSQEQTHISDESTTLQLECLLLAWLFNQTPNTSVRHISIYAAATFLRADSFQHMYYGWCTTNEKQLATHLRDSLPLDLMSMAAIHALPVESSPEDASLLRDAIILFRKCSNHPLLSTSEWHHALNSRYAVEFLKENVFTVSSESEASLVMVGSMIEAAIDQEAWDAVQYLSWSSPKLLLKHKLPNGTSTLHAASVSHEISHEDRAAIFAAAMQEGIDFNTFTRTAQLADDEWTVLHDVAYRGTVAGLQHLISFVPNLDLNVRSVSTCSTPLHIAYYRMNYTPEGVATTLRMIEILLAKGADVQPQDKWGQTPLHCFCRDSDPSFPIVHKLLSAGADPNTLDNYGDLPLHRACESGFGNIGFNEEGLNVMEELIVATSNINTLSEDGNTPLDRAEEQFWRSALTPVTTGISSLMRKHGALLASELTYRER